jgi:hypothetical protein
MNHNIFTVHFISGNKPEGTVSSVRLTVTQLVQICLDIKAQGRRGCIKAKQGPKRKSKSRVTDTLLQCRLLVYDTVQPQDRHENKSHTKIFRNGRDDHNIRDSAGLALSSLRKIRRKIMKSEWQ